MAFQSIWYYTNLPDKIVDIIEEDPFKKLLQKHQKKIITIDKSYIQHFVKISSSEINLFFIGSKIRTPFL